MIDTGEARNVTGHIVSGVFASAIVSGSINYNNYSKGEISKEEAMKNSIKLTAQGGVATGSAIAATNYIGQRNYLGMLAAMTIGFGGVYAIEKVAQNLDMTKQIEEKNSEVGE
jgi:hypothetical protein